ncbi:MAG: hypothetical protein Q8R28_18060 [Dehalococcoidia bacterium]|nr:hypothetical protein [Dehalococcoidia bacterium]
MATRILNWYWHGQGQELQAFYADRDYSPEAVRLYSPAAPGVAIQVDIRDDGVSILSDYASLEGQQTVEDIAGSFPNNKPTIEQGSVITCHIIATGGAATLNVQLEMETIDDGDES